MIILKKYIAASHYFFRTAPSFNDFLIIMKIFPDFSDSKALWQPCSNTRKATIWNKNLISFQKVLEHPKTEFQLKACYLDVRGWKSAEREEITQVQDKLKLDLKYIFKVRRDSPYGPLFRNIDDSKT